MMPCGTEAYRVGLLAALRFDLRAFRVQRPRFAKTRSEFSLYWFWLHQRNFRAIRNSLHGWHAECWCCEVGVGRGLTLDRAVRDLQRLHRLKWYT